MSPQEIAQHLDALSGHLQALLAAQGDKACPSLQKALIHTVEAAKSVREAKA